MKYKIDKQLILEGIGAAAVGTGLLVGGYAAAQKMKNTPEADDTMNHLAKTITNGAIGESEEITEASAASVKLMDRKVAEGVQKQNAKYGGKVEAANNKRISDNIKKDALEESDVLEEVRAISPVQQGAMIQSMVANKTVNKAENALPNIGESSSDKGARISSLRNKLTKGLPSSYKSDRRQKAR